MCSLKELHITISSLLSRFSFPLYVSSHSAPIEAYAKESAFAPTVLAKFLRPHQREGVKFMYDCVLGMKDFDGAGCILADDMGLGKVRHFTLIENSFELGNFLNDFFSVSSLASCNRLCRPCNRSLSFGHYSKRASRRIKSARPSE